MSQWKIKIEIKNTFNNKAIKSPEKGLGKVYKSLEITHCVKLIDRVPNIDGR